MAVFITGMHRSGTSMVARLLNICGLPMGPERDLALEPKPANPQGYFENRNLRKINNRLLLHLGGDLFHPPKLGKGWQISSDLEGVRRSARSRFLARMPADDHWGAKDPRSALTAEFWKAIVPMAKFVICVRHPLEVALSIAARYDSRNGFASFSDSMTTWAASYRVLLRVFDENCIVTHYESYFSDPTGEIRRVADFLDMDVNSQKISRAIETVDETLYRNHLPRLLADHHLFDPEIQDIYDRLCRLAGVNRPAEPGTNAGLDPVADFVTNLIKEYAEIAGHCRNLKNGSRNPALFGMFRSRIKG